MIDERFEREKVLVGKRILEIRKMKKISQLDLGVLMEMDRSEISKYENGKNNIEFRTLIRFAVALEVSTKEFFDFSKIED